MSKQNVARFLQAISEYDALTKKLKSIACSADLLAVATEFGYEFTEEDLFAIQQTTIDPQLIRSTLFKD